MKEQDEKYRSGWDLNEFQESSVLTCQRECISADCSVATTLTFNVNSELYSSQCDADWFMIHVGGKLAFIHPGVQSIYAFIYYLF